MPRIYGIENRTLRLRGDLIWSLNEEGYEGSEIAQLFNMEKSWINRIIKQKPKGFRTLLLPIIK